MRPLSRCCAILAMCCITFSCSSSQQGSVKASSSTLPTVASQSNPPTSIEMAIPPLGFSAAASGELSGGAEIAFDGSSPLIGGIEMHVKEALPLISSALRAAGLPQIEILDLESALPDYKIYYNGSELAAVKPGSIVTEGLGAWSSGYRDDLVRRTAASGRTRAQATTIGQSECAILSGTGSRTILCGIGGLVVQLMMPARPNASIDTFAPEMVKEISRVLGASIIKIPAASTTSSGLSQIQ